MPDAADVELILVFLTLLLTVGFTVVLFGIAKELSLGIFRRFFKILIAAALVSITGRGIALMQLGGRVGPLPVGVDVLSGLLFFLLLTAAFLVLLRDWRRVTLEKPVKRGSANATER
ncbi:MAG: hypothetical protein RMI49_01705 [Candidatus Caldarchaeum sp.]|nr:hypothetical protein [Candidatus Caldarchaeum sp.]